MGPKILISGDEGKTFRYEEAVRQSGGVPAAGYCPAPDLSCDGLLLCGGGDLDCSLFARENLGSDPPDLLRDKAEMELFHAFFEAGKPILGVCRGMQLINVALGGDLIQDLPPHICVFHGRTDHDLVHPIRNLEGSLLYELYGSVCPVNSFHHQAVNRLGAGLRAISWAEGGFPEAVDCPGRPILGVQFHPERMSFAHLRPDTIDAAAIFSHFLTLCRH